MKNFIGIILVILLLLFDIGCYLVQDDKYKERNKERRMKK